uniref:Uncharacterized protein n=1 Tax=Magallana gigas TaxID=29159 RepID=A0A8W8LNN4_MAGGI
MRGEMEQAQGSKEEFINDNEVTAEFDKMVEFNPMRIVSRPKGESVTISGGTPSLATDQIRSGAIRVLGKVDEKSGYDNVRWSNDSQGYFGMIFGGYVMVYTVIPFGFKADHWDECKKLKFADLRESTLGSKELTGKTLQRFAGKCISMDLAVAGCRLFCREVNLVISRAVKSSRHVCLTDELREELEHWRFLDSWEGCCQWRGECHQQVILSSDAFLYKYGAVVEQGRNRYEIGDFFEEHDQRHIYLKEADAVYKVLLALGENGK